MSLVIVFYSILLAFGGLKCRPMLFKYAQYHYTGGCKMRKVRKFRTKMVYSILLAFGRLKCTCYAYDVQICLVSSPWRMQNEKVRKFRTKWQGSRGKYLHLYGCCGRKKTYRQRGKQETSWSLGQSQLQDRQVGMTQKGQAGLLSIDPYRPAGHSQEGRTCCSTVISEYHHWLVATKQTGHSL